MRKSHYRLTLIILWLWLAASSAYGQIASTYDSLRRIYEVNRSLEVSDATLAKNLLDLALEIRVANPELAIDYLRERIRIAQSAGLKTEEGTSYTEIGNIFLGRKMNYNALDYFFKAYTLFEKTKDKKSMAYCLSDIANVYWAEGVYAISEGYYRQMHGIFADLDDTLGMAVALNNLGLVKRQVHDTDSALLFFEQALRLREKMGDPYLIMHSTMYIAGIHLQKGDYEASLRLYDKALFLLNNLKMPFHDDDIARAEIYLMKGQVHQLMNNHRAAIENFQAARKLFIQLGAENREAVVMMNIASGLYYTSDLENAWQMALLALEKAALAGNPDLHYQALNYVAVMAEKTGRNDKALDLYKKYSQLGDSLRIHAAQTRLTDISEAVRLFTSEEGRRAEMRKLQSRQRLIIMVILFLIVMLVVLAFFLRFSRKARKELKNLANAAFEGILIHQKGIILDLNNQSARLLMEDPDSLKGRSIYDFFLNDYRGYIRKLAAGDEEKEYQAEIMRQDHSIIQVEVLSKPIVYKGRRARVAAIRDITSFKKMTEENRVLWSAINQMATIILVTDKDGWITYVNPRFSELTGYTFDEVRDKKPSILNSGAQPPAFYADLWETIKGGRSWTGEFCNKKKDGTFYWVKTIISPVKDANGMITHYIAIKEDITARKAQHQELRRKEVMYHSLVNHMPQTAVFLFDPNLQYVLAEGPVIRDSGLSGSDFVGRPVVEKQSSSGQADISARMRDVFAGKSFTYNTVIASQTFNVKLVPLFDENHMVFLGMMLLQDITEKLEQDERLRQTARELQILNETKDKFISILAHDLRNPFNAILGFSEMLVKDYAELDDETRLKFMNMIYESSDSTYQLLSNLLEWSRAQAGLRDFRPVEIEAKSLVEGALRVMLPMAGNKNISIRNEITAEMRVWADPDMLKTVLRNLITNAIKFTHPGGEVVVKTYYPELPAARATQYRRIVFIVRDNGIGISSGDIHKLFQISSKFSNQGTASEKGTGLGLLLSKEFIEKSRGRIWVESEIGQGSSFYFELPAEPDSPEDEGNR